MMLMTMNPKARKERLYADVLFLTELRPYRNYLNLDSLAQVVSHIKTVFSGAELNVKEQTWIADGREYTNVIGIYNPGRPKTLVVGAHYDVCGDQPGADDNASAVAGLLETARLLNIHKPALDYSVELVAYCLEEPPFFGSTEMGSYVHASSLQTQETQVLGMICYEMIGYFSDEPGSQPFPSPELAKIYPDTGNFIMTVGIERYHDFNQLVCRLMQEAADIPIYNISFPENNGLAGLAGMSDQRNYWKFGFPALMINDTSFVRNPNYHQTTDTIDTLDFEKMTEVVSGAYHAIIGLRN
jgi:Zn-dependent M28 family amino/carboxypeptidase